MKSKKNKIIVFANQKGGVGKSTLCILLADYLVYWKKDVCIIDTDLQQSATLQREQYKQTFGEEEPYSILSFEVSDPKTLLMLMENAQSQDGFILFDEPSTIKDDGLAPMFIYTPVRDKFIMQIVLVALIFLHIQAVPPAYSHKSNMP